MWLRTSADAYVTVVNVPVAGEPTVVFPNEHQPDNFMAARTTRKVPGAGDGFQLRVGAELVTQPERSVYKIGEAVSLFVSVAQDRNLKVT